MVQMDIGLIGCGTVGRGVVDLIHDRAANIRRRHGVQLRLKRIVNRSPVSLPSNVKSKLGVQITRKVDDILNDPEIGCVIELIGGTTTAAKIIREALKKGKHVVTANKALIAEDGHHLFKIARHFGRQIFFEASVAGGIPIIKTLTEGLAANRIHSISAILNGTSNYILTEMSEKGQSFREALEAAKKNGYAEKDPTLDLSGGDARHKLAILATLSLNQYIDCRLVLCEGIKGVDAMDIRFARELGYVVKPLALARVNQNELDIRVHPALLSSQHLLASVNGVYNAVVLRGDRVGETVYTGKGAGQRPTASSVLADIIDCSLVTARSGVAERAFLAKRTIGIRSNSEIRSEYYFRFQVKDQPGVLAQISGILGRYKISVARVIQKENNRPGSVPLVMLTHEAKEGDVQSAMRKINRLSSVKEPAVVLRVGG
jgi:homoserine dehydrogenase